MCNFLSAVLTKDGVLHCYPDVTDSHDLILMMDRIRDDVNASYHEAAFVKLELVPPKLDEGPLSDEQAAALIDPTKWEFKLDSWGGTPPEWFDREHACKLMVERAQRMIVNEKRELLNTGCWILGPEADVAKVRGNARIAVAAGAKITLIKEKAEVTFANGCEIEEVDGNALIRWAYHCSIGTMHHGTIHHAIDTDIEEVAGSAVVCRAMQTVIDWLEGVVYHLCPGSVVKDLERGTIINAYPEAEIRAVKGLSYINFLRSHENHVPCKIGSVHGTLVIGSARAEVAPSEGGGREIVCEVNDQTRVNENFLEQYIRGLRGER